jgi:hypothetical protein
MLIIKELTYQGSPRTLEVAGVSVSSLAVQVLERVKQEATERGCSEKEVVRGYVERLNASYYDVWTRTPVRERVVLLPQCLRNPGCTAPLAKDGYHCQHCAPDCQVNMILQTAVDLGYKAVFILPGGSMVQSILDTVRPSAVLGISCEKEALLGGLLLQQQRVPGRAILLLRDGCVNTAVDLQTVFDTLRLVEP